MLQIFKRTKPKFAVESKISTRLVEASIHDAGHILGELNTSTSGLTNEEVKKRQEHYGKNEVAHEKQPAWYTQLLHAFITPFNGILVFISLVSLFTDIIFTKSVDRSYKTIITLMLMIFLSTILRFWQEYRSNRAAEKLKAMVRTTIAVIRDGNASPFEIPVSELVPGDIVYLSAGDMIPADVRLLSSKDLFISQSVLTGESVPVEKFSTTSVAVPKSIDDNRVISNAFDLDNVCFMGTNVVIGSARAVVVATGKETYFGSMAKQLVGTRPLTSFDRGINKISLVLITFMCVMVPIVFVINGLNKGDWLQALLFSIAVAVGLTPEMLPMIVTANLARGAVAMSKHKCIVKYLNSIQNFGAMNILCTDKTGTLTQDKIILQRHMNVNGKEDIQSLQLAWLNSYHQTGLKNLLDRAVIEFGDLNNAIDKKFKKFTKVDEIPFDFMRRRMSVIVRSQENEQILICKGAVDEIMSICTKVDENGYLAGGEVELTPQLRRKVKRITAKHRKDGMRILAIAYKNVPHEERTYTLEDESNMVLAGYIAFLDPPKESASLAIRGLKESGIVIKVITGDDDLVTHKICCDVGLEIKELLLGREVEAMSDDELARRALQVTVFAKTSPVQKARIIRALQYAGNIVGYMGDGINDAPALREADVGISVDTAVDIAKESSDIILLEKSLMVLVSGVIEGRKTFANIMKYIKMTASSNFGNVLSVLVASAFLPFLPMLPIHLLIQNLLYDISQISIPWDNVDEEYLKEPKKWESEGLARFMAFIGPISSIFDITTYCIMWFVFHANSVEMQSLFQSGWFIEGLLSQTLIVHMIRTEKIPFFQSMSAMPVIMLTLTIIAIGIAIPFSGFGVHVGLHALPISYFYWLALILVSYCALIQLMKRLYIRKFNQWL